MSPHTNTRPTVEFVPKHLAPCAASSVLLLSRVSNRVCLFSSGHRRNIPARPMPNFAAEVALLLPVPVLVRVRWHLSLPRTRPVRFAARQVETLASELRADRSPFGKAASGLPDPYSARRTGFQSRIFPKQGLLRRLLGEATHAPAFQFRRHRKNAGWRAVSIPLFGFSRRSCSRSSAYRTLSDS